MTVTMPKPGEKPKVRFCWICNRQLRGNHFVYFTPPDQIPRVAHKTCAKEAKVEDYR